MITAATLHERTRQDLAQMAKRQGVTGWHSMRKDQLVRALLRKSRSRTTAKRGSRKEASNGSANGNGKSDGKKLSKGRGKVAARAKTSTSPRSTARASKSGNGTSKNGNGKGSKTVKKRNSQQISEQIQLVHAEHDRLKDLSSIHDRVHEDGNGSKVNGGPRRDRVVLLVRDSYWLQASWEIRRKSVERVRAALGAQWHAARPVLRLIELDSGSTTNTSERVAREIEIHGGVARWYIDVKDPPKSYRVDIGYKSDQGQFVALTRSNTVTTPSSGGNGSVDQDWQDIAKDYERIYSMSGGYGDQPSDDLKEWFEERLRRPMGTPMVTRFGVGADAASFRRAPFAFEVDAELVVFGKTQPGAFVTLAGQPVKVRPDGMFHVQRPIAERREVIPVVAGSSDGLEERTVILAIERNTKVMEPVHRDLTEQDPR